MFTVALIGPDGSGKSTVSKHLLDNFSMPVERIYMGINRKESNYVLPSTKLILYIRRKLKREIDQGGPRSATQKPISATKSPIKRIFKEVKSSLVLIDRILEEWYRQFVTWRFTRQDKIVIFDRHFYADYYEYAVKEDKLDTHWTSRVHGYMLENLYPKPNLVIYLDAPAEILFDRKGEGSVELLEQRRQSYLSLRGNVPCFKVVNTNQAVEAVFETVESIIQDYAQTRKCAD